MANYNQNLTFNGLGTLTQVIPATGTYDIRGKITLPNIPAGDIGSSSLVVTINKNGSPIYTGLAGARGFKVTSACTAADTIAIIFSSAATIDQSLNVIKSTITIAQEV